ncbi:MAG: LamG-like jellyroll fold domain-containing protein, partial [Phycisphaeraceae bacterium]
MLMDRCSAFTALLATIASAPALADAGPFAPDKQTLLLAHFDDNVHHADYAQGMHQFAGNGARLVDGYFGKAIDLRARGLTEDFMNQSDDYTPRYDGWGFHGRGNIEPDQGTFECWFKPADANKPKMLWSTNFLNAELGRSVPHPDREGMYIGFGLTLNHYGIRYFFPTLAGNLFQGNVNFANIEGFGRYLDPDNWHHFALTWSQGELVMYIDGRVVLAHDMTDQKGLVLIDNPVRYLSMSDCVVDELRISRVVRYTDEFEPRWRDGKRPDYAFTGNPMVQRYDPKLLPPPTARKVALPERMEPVDVTLGRFALQFDRRSGQLIDFEVDGRPGPASSNGLMLHRGLDRAPLAPQAMENFRQYDGRTRFTQHFADDIVALHELAQVSGTLRWRVTLINETNRQAWLEPLLSLPVPLPAVEEMFDGTAPRRNISVPRHRDVYAHTLPFIAAANSEQHIGVGIDPHVNLSDIVNQWIPVD